MRNVFDQYSQPENRLTHALLTTLDQDRSLLVPFLKWLGINDVPKPTTLTIVEQQVPGDYQPDISEEEAERRGLPDGAIHRPNRRREHPQPFRFRAYRARQGRATIVGTKLSFGPLATTRQAGPPALMDQETKFLKAVETVNRFQIDTSGLLSLLNEDGDTVLWRTMMSPGLVSALVSPPRGRCRCPHL